MTLTAGRLLVPSLLACALIAGLPGSVAAQTTDPCLDALASTPDELERYDTLAMEYLDARNAGEHETALARLGEIEGLCTENLRLLVFRGDAQRELGRCEAAATTYQEVIDQAPSWPHPENADDARARAETGLQVLRTQCVAQVEVNCADVGATVEIAPRPPMLCPATIEVPAGDYQVTVALDGHQPLTRNYTFRTGGNFVEVDSLTPISSAGTVTFACEAPGTEIVLGAERFGCPATRVLASGEYSVAAMRPGQEPWTSTVSVTKGATVDVVVPAIDDEARLELSCDPPAAAVRIEGGALPAPTTGTCPLTVALPAGIYTVTTEAPGHDEDVREIELADGDLVRAAVQLDGADTLLIAIRLFGGAGIIGKDDELVDESVNPDERDTAIAQFAARVNAVVGYNFGDGLHLALGPDLRIGAGGETGFVYGGVAELLFDNREWILMLAGLVGYGKLGVDVCDVSLDRCPTGDDPIAPETEEMVYGGYLGGGFYIGSLSVLFNVGVVSGDLLAIDFGVGIGYRL